MSNKSYFNVSFTKQYEHFSGSFNKQYKLLLFLIAKKTNKCLSIGMLTAIVYKTVFFC